MQNCVKKKNLVHDFCHLILIIYELGCFYHCSVNKRPKAEKISYFPNFMLYFKLQYLATSSCSF